MFSGCDSRASPSRRFPADGFSEWRREGNGKVPVWFHLKKNQPFAFAGLWDMWRDVDGEVLQSFTIITTVPNALLRRILNRMPVIFDALQESNGLILDLVPDRQTLRLS
jgi:putative SOS response-associated peptidase YedK